jgi:hypothetical protein
LNKVIFFILLPLGLVLALTIYMLCRGMENPPFAFSTASPDHTYTIQLKEHADRYLLPIHLGPRESNEVRFSLLKEGRALVKNAGLWSGDRYGGRFLDALPEHKWLSDSILRFGDKDTIPQELHDEILISNSSSKTISYLRVGAWPAEIFLLINLEPGAVRRLAAYPQSDQGSDASWVSCYGRWEDGKDIPIEGMNFDIRGRYKGPAHYCIVIKGEGVQIESKEFEGFNIDASGIKTVTSKGRQCS